MSGISFEATSVATGAAVSTISFNLSTNLISGALIVGVAVVGATVTSVTFNAVALTQQVMTTNIVTSELWALYNPDRGNFTVTANFSGLVTGAIVGASTYDFVHPDYFIDSTAASVGFSTGPNVAVTCSTDFFVVDNLASQLATATPSVRQTQRWNTSAASVIRGASSDRDADNNVSFSMVWTLSAGVRWAHTALTLVPIQWNKARMGVGL